MKPITDEELRQDLNAFYVRLQNSRTKLDELPSHSDNWLEQKKLKEKKRVLRDEIKHVRYLIAIGQEALSNI